MSLRHPGFPAQPLLRPGVRVCRRADGELQVGLDHTLSVRAPDTPDIRALLTGLRDATPPPPPGQLPAAGVRLCDDLLARGLVVDGAALAVALAGTVTPGGTATPGGAATPDGDDDERRESLSGVFSREGLRAAAVLERRRVAAVEVVSPGLATAGARLGELLVAAGVGTITPAGAAPRGDRPGAAGPRGDGPRGDRSGAGGPRGDVVVHVADTEPDRAAVDRWLRADQPHLFVSVTEGLVRVGPFVVPGRTACLRCVDAHLTERDPRRSLVVQQYADRSDSMAAQTVGVPRPVEADLLQLALGYAAREVISWLDGHRPRTWSATVQVDPRLELDLTPWPRHPGCGCSWGLAQAI